MPQRGWRMKKRIEVALGSRTSYMATHTAASIVASRPYKDRQGLNISFVGRLAEQLPFGLCFKRNC